jgi:hypothetical protein
VYNKSNGCSATGVLALGPDHQQQQQNLSTNVMTKQHKNSDEEERKKVRTFRIKQVETCRSRDDLLL